MPRCSFLRASWCLALLASTVARAESPAETTLRTRGLERSGGTYVLTTEAAVLDKVGELKAAHGRWVAARYKLTEVEQNAQAITALTNQAAYLKQEQSAINSQTRNMPRMPRGAGQMMRQNIAVQQQYEQMSINEVNRELDMLKKAMPSPAARKGIDDDITKTHDEATQAAVEARKLVDEANTAYEALAKDDAVKAALVEVKKTTTDAIKLGPSKDFHSAVKAVDSAERLLKLKAPVEAKKTAQGQGEALIWQILVGSAMRTIFLRWPRPEDGPHGGPYGAACGGLISQRSPKKSAATTLPGYREFGGVFRSITAQSGSLGTCRALFR